MWFKFRSIRSRQVFWLLTFSLIPLLVFCVVIYNQRVESIKKEALLKLSAIRDLKVQRINSWLDERIGDLYSVSSYYEIRSVETLLDKAGIEQYDTKKEKIVRQGLNGFRNSYRAYHELFILHPVSGIVKISTDTSQEGKDKSKDQSFTEPMRTGKIYIKDIYYSKTLHMPSMSFSTPIFSNDLPGQIVGVLVARIDLEQSLYALLSERAGMGTTGETFIINKDTVSLNDLRWYKDAPLQLKIDAIPAVNASYGKTGITETLDYRDEMVLAAYTYIPRTKWGFVAKQDLKEVYFPIRGLIGNIIILLVSLAMIATTLAVFLARKLSNPIQHLSKITQEIKDGNLNVQAQITTSDEIGILANAFNDMLSSIKISQDEIKQHRDHLEALVKKRTSELTRINEKLSKEIVERTKMEESLLQIEKLKSIGTITAGISHDFNNILAVISGKTQILQMIYKDSKELTDELRIIKKAADDGAEITSKMLKFTKTKQDINKLVSSNIMGLIMQSMDFTMPRWKNEAQAKGINYQIDKESVKSASSIMCNPAEIREVFINIINNALDAMPEGGSISFSTWSSDDTLFVSISDTGVGMSEEVRKNIFDPFFSTKGVHGTGLGMSMAYGIVNGHGGQIEVNSEIGMGTTFTLQFPITNKIRSQIESPNPKQETNEKNLRILVVDDDEQICNILGKFLSVSGNKVRVVDNGADAINIIKTESFDLVLCDLAMPNVYGYDVIKAVNELEKRPKIGIITGWGEELKSTEESRKVDFILRKPFDLSELAGNINDVFGERSIDTGIS